MWKVVEPMLKNLKFFLYLLRTSLKASISKRGAFLIESGLMVANNFIFLSMWWIFFRQFNDVAGWNFQDMIILTSVGIGGFGLMHICFGGVKTLSKTILQGDLDPFMTQPKNLLLHIAGSRSVSKGWGHLMTALLTIFLGGIATPYNLAIISVSILCSCLIFTSANIIAHSLAFWMGSIETVSKKYCDALFLFAHYPTNIYSGFLQVIMFTFIPAGIITYLPVELVRHFSWLHLSIFIASSVSFIGIAFFVFYAGLRKYESGNKFGLRL
jgi:ABC-2 type transport system permease protein